MFIISICICVLLACYPRYESNHRIDIEELKKINRNAPVKTKKQKQVLMIKAGINPYGYTFNDIK